MPNRRKSIENTITIIDQGNHKSIYNTFKITLGHVLPNSTYRCQSLPDEILRKDTQTSDAQAALLGYFILVVSNLLARSISTKIVHASFDQFAPAVNEKLLTVLIDTLVIIARDQVSGNTWGASVTCKLIKLCSHRYF